MKLSGIAPRLVFRNFLWIILAVLPFANFAQSKNQADTIQQVTKPPSQATTGFIDLNGYYDTRKSSDFTLNILANLPHRFQYFTFTNYYSATSDADLAIYYSEHHVYWALTSKSPIDASLQWMTLSGNENDALRLGARWRLHNTNGLTSFFSKIGLIYTLAFHIYQFDEQASRSPWLTQIEHFYRLNLYKNKVYISGFADQDVFYTGSKTFSFVTEHQLGVRLANNFYIVAEYRYNDYLPSKNGVGIGFEYQIRF